MKQIVDIIYDYWGKNAQKGSGNLCQFVLVEPGTYTPERFDLWMIYVPLISLLVYHGASKGGFGCQETLFGLKTIAHKRW
jgi:hypothetical protein